MSKETKNHGFVETEIIHVVEKSRISNEGPSGPIKDTWKEIKEDPDAVTEELADFIWHEFSIDVESEDIDVVSENEVTFL